MLQASSPRSPFSLPPVCASSNRPPSTKYTRITKLTSHALQQFCVHRSTVAKASLQVLLRALYILCILLYILYTHAAHTVLYTSAHTVHLHDILYVLYIHTAHTACAWSKLRRQSNGTLSIMIVCRRSLQDGNINQTFAGLPLCLTLTMITPTRYCTSILYLVCTVAP